MRPALRHLLVLTLIAAGSALLAVAAIDWLAYVFARVDHLAYEARLHDDTGFRHRSAWNGPLSTVPGRALPVSAVLGLLAAVAAVVMARLRRPANALLTLAATCTALAVAATAWATLEFHANAIHSFFKVQLGPTIRRLEHPDYLRWDLLAVQELGAFVSTLLIPALALAAIHVAIRRGAPRPAAWLTAAALALPITLATAAITVLWRTHGHFASVGHDRWADLIQAVRPLPIAAAALVVLLAAITLRSRPRSLLPRLALALALPALGLAAVVATQPHRRTIDTLYPLRDPGAEPLHRSYEPWTLAAPLAERCAQTGYPRYTARVHLDETDAVVLSIDGRIAVFGDEPALTGLLAALTADIPVLLDPPRPIGLLVERRVPIAALAPLLSRLPSTEISPLLVLGTFLQPMPSVDGPLLAANLCVIGQIELSALASDRLAAGATWGALVDDPALMFPVITK
jgi:hypothetical protein